VNLLYFFPDHIVHPLNIRVEHSSILDAAMPTRQKEDDPMLVPTSRVEVPIKSRSSRHGLQTPRVGADLSYSSDPRAIQSDEELQHYQNMNERQQAQAALQARQTPRVKDNLLNNRRSQDRKPRRIHVVSQQIIT